MPVTLSEWFCLQPTRTSFKPNANRDGALLFCHENKIQEEIVISIERSFAINRPVKMVLFGDWGVGKTHTINHISWWFDSHVADYPAKTILVEVGDVTSKSRFDILVAPFLDKIGLRELVRLVHQYQAATKKHVVGALKELGSTANVAEAFGKFLLAPPEDTPPPNVATAFEFLKGLKTKDAAGIGLGNPITQSDEYYSVLLCCGALFKAVEKKQLIFVADEAAKLEDIDADEATSRHWTATNRMIFDDNNLTFGFIYTLSGRKKNMPDIIVNPQIENRLGQNNVIELPNLATTDVKSFLSKLRESFVDKQKVEALVASGQINGAEFDWATYPFDKQAWEAFIDYWNNNQEEAKPRDICDKLDDVAFRAIRDNKRLINEDCLKKAKM